MNTASTAFCELMQRMTAAIVRGDGTAAAACFTPQGVYHDGFYGDFRGHAAIADMVVNHFHANARDLAWSVDNCLSDGVLGYAHYDFSYVSKMEGSAGKRVRFEGMARCELKDGLIDYYTEIFERGIALAQLEFAPERIIKSLRRWGRVGSA